MREIVKIFALIFSVMLITACCDRRCGVHGPEVSEPINLQEKISKMKEQAGDKGSK
jgi:hypothetical protein